MKHLAPLAALLVLLASCGGYRYLPSGELHTGKDSTRVSTQQLDSIYRVLLDRDSTYKHDSIYVYVKGDTVTKYVERETYRYRILRDTCYRYRVSHDTLYIEKRDTTTIIQPPVEIAKPIAWYNQGFIWLGRLCLIALIIWAIVLYLKRKF